MVMRAVSFKIHPEQYRILKSAADNAGVSPGVYARMRALQDAGISELEARLAASEATIISTFKGDLKKVADYLVSRLPQHP